VAEHIALELQTLAHMECGFGRTRSATDPGTYHVVFAYEIENAGVYAGKAAVRIIEALINGKEYDVNKDITELERINRYEGLGPSTFAIVKEAQKRGIPFTRLDNNSLIMLGQGCNQRVIDATIAYNTSGIAIDIVSDKELTRRILSNMYINFPDASVIR
jgi:cyanophycin synthetase